MPMDPRHLRTLAVVVRRASFSAAARELGYTQSAVSQHVAALEADLGTTLVRRRPVAPTEAGARLLEHAGAILLRLDAARADVIRVAAGPRGRLVVGATPLAAAGRRRRRGGRQARAPRADRDGPGAGARRGGDRRRDRRAGRRRRRRGRRARRPAAAPRDRACPSPPRARRRSPSRSRPAIRSPARAASGSRTSRTRAGSTRRRSARRSPPSPCSPARTASAPPRATTASTSAACSRSSRPARDSRCSRPRSRRTASRSRRRALVHRTELLTADPALVLG